MTHLKKNEMMEYIDKELSPERMKVAAAHLAGCRRCSGRVENLSADILLVRRSIERLDPEAVEIETAPPVVRQGTRQRMRPAGVKPSRSWKERFNGSVRIPVPVMALAMVVFLVMSAGLFLQHLEIGRLKIPFLAAQSGEKTTLYVVDDQHIRTEVLDLNLDSFKPIAKPKIYKKVYKKTYKVNQAKDVL